MNITIYLGSHMGRNEKYKPYAEQLGCFIGENGHTLVYGGAKNGLMGVLGDAALAAGATVIGVIPDFMLQDERQHKGLTKMLRTKDMAERKAKMEELGDVFLAFPGGIGTLEEIAVVMSDQKLGHLPKPFAFLNFDGFYDPMKALLQKMTEEGFIWPEWTEQVPFLENMEQVEEFIDLVKAKSEE